MRGAFILALALSACATVQTKDDGPTPIIAKFGDRVIRQSEVDEKVIDELSKLQDRAAKAERYAAAASDVAVAALDEAEEASLEAWLARQDADAASAK